MNDIGTKMTDVPSNLTYQFEDLNPYLPQGRFKRRGDKETDDIPLL